ncbi:TerB family tellurite resistance protein [Maritalea sp.]|uniref:tellurite resistance TerB family protein n=1 Tax=Maritalea sp. TaxID=2003361 RepID=UPI003EF964D8
MFDAITRLLGVKTDGDMEDPLLDPKLCAAALLVHLSAVDGQVSDDERKTIEKTLIENYQLSTAEVADLVVLATQKDQEAVDFYAFTATLNKLELDEKLNIIRMMWEVVFADNQNHELEDNMVWRVAELIGVSSRDRTVLRAQVRGETQSDS